jgi:hypothetical protein
MLADVVRRVNKKALPDFIAATGTSYAANQSSTLLTLSVPAGVQQGDLLIAAIVKRGTYSPTLAGWTLLASAGTNQFWFARIASASEPASYTWSYSTNTQATNGVMAAYRYKRAPLAVSYVAVLGAFNPAAAGPVVVAPSISPSTKARLVTFLAEVGTSAADSWQTSPAGMTNRMIRNASFPYRLDDQQVAPGPTGTRSATSLQAAGTGYGASLALLPN